MFRARLGECVPVAVGADRYATGKAMQARGTKWFILDDGFQHLALQRDADIVLLDSQDLFGGGDLLPAGRLREPPSALARADIIVITRSEPAAEMEGRIRRFTSAPLFYARPELDAVLAAPDISRSIPGYKGAKVFAFCGIGNPAAFLRDLDRWGFCVAGAKSFRDHHRYTSQDLRQLVAEARTTGAKALICTEKDVFNLPSSEVAEPRIEGGEGPLPIWACRIRLEIRDAQEFWGTLMSSVHRHRLQCRKSREPE